MGLIELIVGILIFHFFSKSYLGLYSGTSWYRRGNCNCFSNLFSFTVTWLDVTRFTSSIERGECNYGRNTCT